MIQSTGKIKVNSPEESYAVQKRLFEMGYKWLQGSEVRKDVRRWIRWEEHQNKCKRLYFNSEHVEAPVHTLADFNLDSEGNELPTFGHLKAGDPNPFVVGTEVESNGLKGTVIDSDEGPSIEVKWCNGMCNWSGYYSYGKAIESTNINTIFPTTQEQPAPHEYKFGDKVKVGNNKLPRYFMAYANGNVIHVSGYEFNRLNPVGNTYSSAYDLSENVSPWPEPVTLWFCTSEDREEEDRVTISKDGVSLGRKGYSLEDAIAIGEEAAKIRGNE